MLVQVLAHEGCELVEVQWPEELTPPIVEVLLGIYEDVEGIDEVDLRRYRHMLEVAPHIRGETDLAEELQRVLLDSEELAWALNQANLGELEVQVAQKISGLTP
jgi:hypothetical protein